MFSGQQQLCQIKLPLFSLLSEKIRLYLMSVYFYISSYAIGNIIASYQTEWICCQNHSKLIQSHLY